MYVHFLFSILIIFYYFIKYTKKSYINKNILLDSNNYNKIFQLCGVMWQKNKKITSHKSIPSSLTKIAV